MSSKLEAVCAYVEGAPPGELAEVITDIEALTENDPSILSQLGPTYKKYNEDQFATVKLPGSSQHVYQSLSSLEAMMNRLIVLQVIISSYNSLGDNRYYDVESSSIFTFDHTTQIASNVQSYPIESIHLELLKSISKIIKPYIQEHYPNASFGVYPVKDDSEIAILIVANKYSPKNFWNGRWRSLYTYSPSSLTLEGFIKVDVHYYENGNVRLLTTKPITISLSSNTASAIVQEISGTERRYQEELNKGFHNLSEGAFKGLRRQLPVTRQKVEWDKIAGYRLGQDIGGGTNNR
ncbi:F-actin-capping protein subunit alpha [Golovinomyces cichoracearum]|uniref:F-actin-capping protein subunit alpha n=1 Tax=Golovinomyces cichoracearum TaxID=62708 RepID=A0A420IKF9_9PEZI|nr:F-actin-capping protein subunit alpha [Golovinomyces cichoracearum]